MLRKYVKVAVVVFPGSNCDRDIFHVLSDVFQFDTEYYWHEKHLPQKIDAVVLPGGFSYGDRLRAGAIAAHSPIISDIKKLAKRGVPILGICNGFQILVESELLPGVLLKNDSLNFMCKWTNLLVKNNKTPFTSKLKYDQKIPIPIANGEGRYFADEKTLSKLQDKNQIVFIGHELNKNSKQLLDTEEMSYVIGHDVNLEVEKSFAIIEDFYNEVPINNFQTNNSSKKSKKNIHTNSATFLNLLPKCEPQLGKRGLRAQIGGWKNITEFNLAILWILNQSDGMHSLQDIKKRSDLDYDLLLKVADLLEEKKLLSKVEFKG